MLNKFGKMCFSQVKDTKEQCLHFLPKLMQFELIKKNQPANQLTNQPKSSKIKPGFRVM